MEYYLDSKNISLVKYVKLQIKNFFKIPNFWWLFGFAFLIYGLALFSLFRADIYYIDDWSRSTDGGNWNNFSRYIASYLMRIAQLGIRNTDIAPLYQIFGICVIIFSSMWLIYALYNKIDKLSILAVAPLGLSPYFLENLSYRYDAFLMSAAVGFAIFPFGFYKNRLAFFIISSICIFLMLGCYQAANSVYIVIGIYIAIFSLFIKRQSVSNVLGFIALWLGGLGVGSIAFKVILLKPVDVYVSSNTLSLSEIAGGG